LALLVEAWPLIHRAVPEAELLIFSSLKVYKREDSMEERELYEQAKNLPGVIYRGSLGQKELREEIQTCRVLAYPCIFPETSCITAMEAMASGCVVVSTALGALPETAWKNPLIPMGDGWIRSWAFEVCYFLVNQPRYEDIASQNLAVSNFFGWDLVAKRWVMRMQGDLKIK
jgi:glycosyltransferase involved in cell wall biosynthesis